MIRLLGIASCLYAPIPPLLIWSYSDALVEFLSAGDPINQSAMALTVLIFFGSIVVGIAIFVFGIFLIFRPYWKPAP
jgi:hypothetical protein